MPLVSFGSKGKQILQRKNISNYNFLEMYGNKIQMYILLLFLFLLFCFYLNTVFVYLLQWKVRDDLAVEKEGLLHFLGSLRRPSSRISRV